MIIIITESRHCSVALLTEFKILVGSVCHREEGAALHNAC